MIKNIVILEDSSKVTFGGGQKGTLEIINILKNNFNVTIFDCSHDSLFQKKMANVKIKKLFLKCYGKLVSGEFSSFSIGYKEILLFPIFGLYNILKLLFFIRHNKLNRKDTLFYTSNKKHLLLLFVVKKIVNMEYIYHARTYDDKNSKFYRLLIPALHNARTIICVSEFIKNNINYTNCTVLYNPIVMNSMQKKLHTSKKIEGKKRIVIATLSELLKWKGIDTFVNSYSYLQKNEYDIKYYIYGKGLEENNLKNLARVNKNIIFKGFIEKINDEIINVIDIIIVPSTSPESFGRTSMEGSYFGVVPLATQIGAQKELLENIDKNLLFEVNNPQDLALKIDYAINNYANISKKAVSFSDSFSLEEFQIKILQIFG